MSQSYLVAFLKCNKCNKRFTCRQTSKEIGITGKSEAEPAKFSKTYVFRIKMFDSTQRLPSQ